MGTLTSDQLVKIQNRLERKMNESGKAIFYGKAAIKAIAQTIEDELSSAEVTIGAAIDVTSASFGFSLTNQEKKWLGRVVMWQKYVLDVEA